MARDEAGRSLVIHERADGSLRSVRPAGTEGRSLLAAPEGLRLVGDPAWASSGTEHPADRVVLAPGGRLALDGPRSALLLSVAAGHVIPLGEVHR